MEIMKLDVEKSRKCNWSLTLDYEHSLKHLYESRHLCVQHLISIQYDTSYSHLIYHRFAIKTNYKTLNTQSEHVSIKNYCWNELAVSFY